ALIHPAEVVIRHQTVHALARAEILWTGFGDHGRCRLQLPCAFVKDLAVEYLDDAVGRGISHLNFILGGDTPKTGFADIRFTGGAFGINLPRARAKGEVLATIVGND